jgi:hypothetical protein
MAYQESAALAASSPRQHSSPGGHMQGVRVGKRIIGADAPVNVGWDNVPRVEGGPVKQFIFTYFQPAALFALLAFWY